ncbi:Decaprenyl diphosphate synthase-like protein [Kalaharituber pfeilii]|nr:Decaprenyl diphosphate synthase-like protein [Kalaharituber pfeilii]
MATATGVQPVPPSSRSLRSKMAPGLRPLQTNQKDIDALERERLIQPYLPPASPVERSHPIKNFIVTRFYRLILAIIHLIYTIYHRIRYVYNLIVSRVYSMLYYHHRTPQLIQKDVRGLGRLPNHLSIILDYDKNDRVSGLDTLIDDVAEIACWCASAGIPMLSVYEQTGVLKGYITTSHRAIAQRLHAYFGKERPTLRVRAPHSPAFTNGDTPADSAELEDADLEILFISEEDGRESLVDLTRTLCEMAQRGKISVGDVTQDLIDAEISGTLMTEPDLLIIFNPSVNLKGYPPWQIRLTEMFYVRDNEGVRYQIFLRAMYKYAKAEMRFGR